MVEIELKNFNHNKLPFLFLIPDPNVAQQVIDVITQYSFGLEIGYGAYPVRYNQIDRTIPWLGAEIDPNALDSLFKYPNLVADWAKDEEQNPMKQPCILTTVPATPELIHRASTLVFRNFDPADGEVLIPHFMNLRQGQRVLFIVNSSHTHELSRYAIQLYKLGYNQNDLNMRSPELPCLTAPPPWNYQEYVLDLTK